MEFIIKFGSEHESFRVPEIEALAVVEGIDLTVLEQSQKYPFCFVRLPSIEAAKKLVRRSVLAQSIHEHWASGKTYDELHENIKTKASHHWPKFKETSFRFAVDSYQGARTNKKRLAIIDSFSYLPFDGPIKLSGPDDTFTVFELWPFNSVPLGIENPDKIHMGRYIAGSSREVIHKYDLKKRDYISTTSMDAELALVTANIALAAPGKLFYDPFVGTGSFPIACAHFGAIGWGSDIDGRSIRGEGGQKSLPGNFKQYELTSLLGGAFSADLTNTPIRQGRRLWDGIVCDPPYGVREGLRVLGLKEPDKATWLVERGVNESTLPDYVPPKKPYSFLAMLDDILAFAAGTLVDNGRLSFWMPTANDEEQELGVPQHPGLEVVVVCVQVFNKWSRRLITYRRIPDDQVSPEELEAFEERRKVTRATGGTTADDLNPFRRGYFKGFELDEKSSNEERTSTN